MTRPGRTVLTGYAWLYAAFALALTVATPFDVTHAGDGLSVAAALVGAAGLFASLYRRPALPVAGWRWLLAVLVAYDLAVLGAVLATGTEALGRNGLIGSTAPGSKAYDLGALALGLPALGAIAGLGRRPAAAGGPAVGRP